MAPWVACSAASADWREIVSDIGNGPCEVRRGVPRLQGLVDGHGERRDAADGDPAVGAVGRGLGGALADRAADRLHQAVVSLDRRPSRDRLARGGGLEAGGYGEHRWGEKG